MSDNDIPHSHSLSLGREDQSKPRWTESLENDFDNEYNEYNDHNDTNNNDHHELTSEEPEANYEPFSVPSRPSLGSRSSSYSSDSDTSVPVTPLTPKFQLPSESASSHHSQDYTKTPNSQGIADIGITQDHRCQETPKTVISPSPTTTKKIIFQETPKKQIITRVQAHPTQEIGVRTPPNSRLRNLVRQPLLEPQPIILRPTTFWRHHPLSPHCLPRHSPSSRLIRRSTLIASPTIGVQHPNPDQETTRICVGLAGIDLDIDPRARKLSLIPI
ncbi:hypothetical protein I302_100763 [Kwoniella bestiolae CBS 10118]|uniref:Uncharacterized protein n=1 Tax=Kwoniella bestiolae CBS 10118 TaxID=1296100 RepID=A0A1B9G626_9TREE|nr:hypothetical protein I302_04136 [Kwoniella bestiolae CBS 10118]OCF26451.1 hypothetical protein I302_04136 [Kwoniella bestiolae CBS 10118]